MYAESEKTVVRHLYICFCYSIPTPSSCCFCKALVTFNDRRLNIAIIIIIIIIIIIVVVVVVVVCLCLYVCFCACLSIWFSVFQCFLEKNSQQAGDLRSKRWSRPYFQSNLCCNDNNNNNFWIAQVPGAAQGALQCPVFNTLAIKNNTIYNIYFKKNLPTTFINTLQYRQILYTKLG